MPLTGRTPPGGVGNETGSSVTADKDLPAMTAQAKAKVAATIAWNAAVERGDAAGARQALERYASDYNTAKSSGGLQPSATIDPGSVPSAKYLGVTQVGQNKSYYCGPASGYMIIRYLHGAGFTSRYDGSQPGQAGLANANHMRTDLNGRTDWSSQLYVTGINRWRGVNYYVQVNRPTAATTKSIILMSIGASGMPYAADTVEFAYGDHYNFHPKSLTIGHWITGYGYSNSGATSYWADPSTSVWPGVSPTFSYSTATFANLFLQSNGIVY